MIVSNIFSSFFRPHLQTMVEEPLAWCCYPCLFVLNSILLDLFHFPWLVLSLWSHLYEYRFYLANFERSSQYSCSTLPNTAWSRKIRSSLQTHQEISWFDATQGQNYLSDLTCFGQVNKVHYFQNHNPRSKEWFFSILMSIRGLPCQ